MITTIVIVIVMCANNRNGNDISSNIGDSGQHHSSDNSLRSSIAG